LKRKIKNYTTGKPAHETIAEIQRMLAEAGATGIAMEFDDSGGIESLFFKMKVDEKEMPFKLPAKPEAVYKILFADMLQKNRYDEDRKQKSLNIAWRIIRDWLDAQLALVKLEQAEAAEIFFPYLLVEDNKTLYEAAKITQFENLLPSGKKDDKKIGEKGEGVEKGKVETNQGSSSRG